MDFNIKLTRAAFLIEENKANQLEYIDAVDDGCDHNVKFTTNKLVLEKDRKDERFISTIKYIKIIYELDNGGCLILFGHLGCSFRYPFGGEFTVTKAIIDDQIKFDDVEGVEGNVCFGSFPMSIDAMRQNLEELSKNPKLVYNISQFDEFMDIFDYYRKLSAQLNNTTTYKIKEISAPYYFVSVGNKNVDTDKLEAIYDSNGIVVGYVLEDYKYDMLPSDEKESVKSLVDITIDGSINEFKKIKSFSDNLYVDNIENVSEDTIKQLIAFDLVTGVVENDSVVLIGELTKGGKFQYLHLYDMGQKVKLESIDNSLRLINQGASGAAAELLEYIIGSKMMPNAKRVVTPEKLKYIDKLDESQKEAFLMATDGSPVSLIKGPPGTGKTYVINAIVQYITKELKEKVIISSQTHVAIDNVLDELMENYDLIIPNRITNRKNKYSGEEIDSTLYKTWAKKIDEHSKRCANQDLAQYILKDLQQFTGEKRFSYSQNMLSSEYSVIGATTTTSEIGGKRGLDVLSGYDWLIIDEVSKCPITEVLRYLPYVKRIIMVGDDFQLAPLLEFSKEDVKDFDIYDDDKFERLRKIYEESVFAKTLEKAKEAGRLVLLNVNYRSVKDVLNAYNIFYDNQLINMREKVKVGKVQFTNKYNCYNDKDIFFVDVQNGKEALEGTSKYNLEELSATAEILSDLIENTLNPKDVTISAIFPYGAQIEKFERQHKELINKAKLTFKSFELDTVDAFQGRETDIVLVNTVVTVPYKTFLRDFRRINVSMSRARDKLFIFGNPTTLSKIEMNIADGNKRTFFADIIDDVRRFGALIQYNGELIHDTSKPKIKIH